MGHGAILLAEDLQIALEQPLEHRPRIDPADVVISGRVMDCR
jgi:hypothetical protein